MQRRKNGLEILPLSCDWGVMSDSMALSSDGTKTSLDTQHRSRSEMKDSVFVVISLGTINRGTPMSNGAHISAIESTLKIVKLNNFDSLNINTHQVNI